MAVITLRNGTAVGDYMKPYFVAELNTSHFGDLKVAREMIDSAGRAGCHCVKFQSWSTDSLYSATYYRQNTIAKRMVQKFALPEKALEELSAYSREVGIDFASTPYSPQEAAFLVERCNVPFVKIASMELNNLTYLDFLGRLGAPLVLSTGMGTLEEITQAVEVIEKTGNTNLVILHCVSVYPARSASLRLNNIIGLRSEFPRYPIGYSDHSMGVQMATGAIALGACLIEKHFTLDRSRIGMDNHMATEPEEMGRMVKECQSLQVALGGTGRVLDEDEAGQRPKMRRSLVAAKALRAGHVLTREDLDAKRPGTGIPPTQLVTLIGRQLRLDVGEDELIEPAHLEPKSN